jgi:hypothetical protein
MAKAHLLEKNQGWIGGALDAGLLLDSAIRDWTADYPVPLKSSHFSAEPPVALNWIGPNCPRQEIEDALRGATEEAGPSNAAENKLHNTLEFVHFVYDNARFAPILGRTGH